MRTAKATKLLMNLENEEYLPFLCNIYDMSKIKGVSPFIIKPNIYCHDFSKRSLDYSKKLYQLLIVTYYEKTNSDNIFSFLYNEKKKKLYMLYGALPLLGRDNKIYGKYFILEDFKAHKIIYRMTEEELYKDMKIVGEYRFDTEFYKVYSELDFKLKHGTNEY